MRADLSETTSRVYEVVRAEPGLSVSAIARRLAVASATAKYHLDRLSRRGLVVLSRDGRDLRATVPGVLPPHCPTCGARTLDPRSGGNRWRCTACHARFEIRMLEAPRKEAQHA